MNFAALYFYLVAIMCLVARTVSRAIPKENEEKDLLSRSKRSQTADHLVSNKMSRHQAALARKLHLARIINSIDTSGRLPATPSGTEVVVPTTTTINIKSNDSVSSSKRKKNRGKGRRGEKRRGNKKSRKSRSRRRRMLAKDILDLLEGDQGEAVLQAIATAVDEDYQYKDSLQELEDFIQDSAKKCKCSCGRKSRD